MVTTNAPRMSIAVGPKEKREQEPVEAPQSLEEQAVPKSFRQDSPSSPSTFVSRISPRLRRRNTSSAVNSPSASSLSSTGSPGPTNRSIASHPPRLPTHLSLQAQLVELHSPTLLRRSRSSHEQRLLSLVSVPGTASSSQNSQEDVVADDGQGGYGGVEKNDVGVANCCNRERTTGKLGQRSPVHIDNVDSNSAEHRASRRRATIDSDVPQRLKDEHRPHVQQPPLMALSPASYDEPSEVKETMSSTAEVKPATPMAAGQRSLPALLTPSSLTEVRSNDGLKGNGGGSTTSLGDLSAYSTSLPSESPHVAGHSTGPRSSILLNPSNKKTFVDAWRPLDGSGPSVLQIPAVPTARDRELEKEKERLEREKEIERELKEKEQAEKVWGIPKKAFYMGLGEINFNAQMAILGGWGNGSGPATDFRPGLAPQPLRRPSSSGGRPSSSAGREKSKREKERQQAMEREQAERKRKEKERERERRREEGEESEESMDLEELASLNAIINTRRSMEAAQALASGQHRISLLKKSVSHASLEDSLHQRPSLSTTRQESNESVPVATPTSNDQDSPPSVGHKAGISQTSSELCRQQSRIRFAPLPQAYGSLAADSPTRAGGDLAATTLEGTPGATSEVMGLMEKSPSEGSRLGQDESDSSEGDESDEGEESWSRRLSVLGGSSKSKWYLMGMPKSVFKPNSYRSLRRPSSTVGAESASAGELSASPGHERSLSSGAVPSEKRGRRTSRRRGNGSRASSIKSRSSSVGSNDEDERRRRRQLIRASRPGGTGMVTLPDGTRIRARRVGEEDSEEEEFNEWGFAGLAKEARRKSYGEAESKPTDEMVGEKRASDEEGGREEDGSGTAWVKRRRRELEESSSRTAREQRPSSPQTTQTGEANEAGSPIRSVSPVKKSPASKNVESFEAPARATTLTLSKPTLSASQAAEVRRRHEEEVAALGAEVLQNIAKAKKAKQNPSRSATVDVGSQIEGNSAGQVAGGGAAVGQTLPKPTVGERVRDRERPRRALSLDESGNKPVPLPIRQPRLAKVRATGSRSSSQSEMSGSKSGSQLKQSSSQPIDSSDDIETPTGEQTPTRRTAATSSLLGTPLLTLTAEPDEVEEGGISNLPGTPDSHLSLLDAEVTPTRGAKTALALSDSTPPLPDSPISKQRSRSPDSKSLGTMSSSSSLAHLAKVGGRLGAISIPIPSPELPRRPDARGYAVVPLPVHQLGRRPERPREGRVWQYDDDDDDEDGEVEEEEEEGSSEEEDDDEDGRDDAASQNRRNTKEEEEEEETAMDAEELEEEERRTAMQKKRATTRAAGAELVSVLAKSKQPTAPRSPRLQRSPKLKEKESSEVQVSPTPSERARRGGIYSPSSSNGKAARRETLRPTASTSALPGRRRRRGKDTWNDMDDEEGNVSDDLDLWPPTLSTTQLNSTLSTKESGQTLSGSLGKSSIKSRTGSRTATDADALATHSARAKLLRKKKSREAKEQERLRILQLKENDEFLDYGWPRSLQGSSLYN